MAPFYASRLEPLWGGSLLFTGKFPEITGTHFINFRRMKGRVNLGNTQWFWTRDLEALGHRFIMLYDEIWWCNIEQFLSYSNNYISKFMPANLWHKLFHFRLSFWIWKVWKGRGKKQNIEYLEIEKSFFDKNIFHTF